MAGKIIADQIEHSTAGSLDTSYVVNGSAKAWVNFNGTGTVAIRESFSTSSITDNGTGNYTVNFTTAMSDADYSVVATGDFTLGTDGLPFLAVNSDGTSGSKTTSNFGVTSFVPSFSLSDVQGIFISVFR
jgi:hypothetical protein